MISNPTIEKYKRLFGIECELVEFDPETLKSRWRHLCLKYHPDKPPYGNKTHFEFVQEAYKYLKEKCKGIKQEEEQIFVEELYGIRELSGKSQDGTDWYLWDIGEANFQKRAEWEKKFGKGSGVFVDKKETIRTYGKQPPPKRGRYYA